MHVLSVSSLKGGVGKTTVALGLASAAFARGLRTLVVDLDPQCDATTGLGALGVFRETITDVLQAPKHNIVHRAIVASPWAQVRSGSIDVLVGSRTVAVFDTPEPKLRDIWKLEEALSKVESDYDVVIIDTPPSLNGLTRTAWVCSDRVLLVSEPSIYAVTATDRAFTAIDEIRRKLNTRLDHAGIVVNRYQPENREHEFRVQELDKLFGERLFAMKIPERATIQQAQGAARPIHSWPGESAAEISQIFDQVLDRIEDSFKSESRRNRKQENKDHKANSIMRGQSLDQFLGFENFD